MILSVAGFLPDTLVKPMYLLKKKNAGHISENVTGSWIENTFYCTRAKNDN